MKQIPEIQHLGLRPYDEVREMQKEIFEANIQAKIKNQPTRSVIFSCEHPHVYTLGKSADPNNLLIQESFLKKINAQCRRIERGGDITYHGPGQLVIYPIIDLEQVRLGIKEYIQSIEKEVIKALQKYKIAGEISPGNIGVWLDVGSPKERKICAIGVKASRSITMHGLALNINTDLNYFNYINPCGFIDKGVTSVQAETGSVADFDALKNELTAGLQKRFTP